jgi:mono/diheme cytochrome c family protein
MLHSKLFAFCLATAMVCSTALAAKKGDAEKGKEVFQQCTPCHNPDSNEKKMGPGLKGLFGKEKLNNGKPVTEENIRTQIDDGGNGMPAYKEMLKTL